MKRWSILLLLELVACGTAPRYPRWENDAYNALDSFKRDYLAGYVARAQTDFAAVQNAYSSTGRLDLAAHAELFRCALGITALDFAACNDVAAHLSDASADDQAYGALLAGDWTHANAGNLPAQYRDFARAATAEARNAAAQKIDDPLSRLVAAGILFRANEIAPNTISAATDAATAQGWRRPLLAWLRVQLKQAQAAGDTTQAQALQQRLDFASQKN